MCRCRCEAASHRPAAAGHARARCAPLQAAIAARRGGMRGNVRARTCPITCMVPVMFWHDTSICRKHDRPGETAQLQVWMASAAAQASTKHAQAASRRSDAAGTRLCTGACATSCSCPPAAHRGRDAWGGPRRLVIIPLRLFLLDAAPGGHRFGCRLAGRLPARRPLQARALLRRCLRHRLHKRRCGCVRGRLLRLRLLVLLRRLGCRRRLLQHLAHDSHGAQRLRQLPLQRLRLLLQLALQRLLPLLQVRALQHRRQVRGGGSGGGDVPPVPLVQLRQLALHRLHLLCSGGPLLLRRMARLLRHWWLLRCRRRLLLLLRAVLLWRCDPLRQGQLFQPCVVSLQGGAGWPRTVVGRRCKARCSQQKASQGAPSGAPTAARLQQNRQCDAALIRCPDAAAPAAAPAAPEQRCTPLRQHTAWPALLYLHVLKLPLLLVKPALVLGCTCLKRRALVGAQACPGLRGAGLREGCQYRGRPHDCTLAVPRHPPQRSCK